MDETQETLHNLKVAGFPANDIEVVDGVVIVGGDMAVSLQASREMLESDGSGQEQYRTSNLVSSDIQMITIRSSGSVSAPIVRGILDAIENYNALSLGFDFQYLPEPCELDPNCPPRPPYANIDLIINPAVPSGGGALATTQLPSGGKPGASMALSQSLATYSRDFIEHVVTHEIGHALGLRHSDFYNRAISCGGSAVNEGASGVGAILIPGTPSTATVGGSIMNSCYPANATGEFTATDITALETLY
ncbi:M57 family metalloprotease [Pyxidicoccus parkwayensis]|nr:M57 family metalloprotease [Pyxidicoccus parkwaysis]